MRFPSRAALAVALVAITLGGCSTAPQLSFFPGVHRINILQGNILSQEKVDQLQPGMTKNQVRYVLGTPLIEDPFNRDEWNYVYNLRDPDGNEIREHLRLTFEAGELVQIEGDYAPSSSADPEDDFS